MRKSYFINYREMGKFVHVCTVPNDTIMGNWIYLVESTVWQALSTQWVGWWSKWTANSCCCRRFAPVSSQSKEKVEYLRKTVVFGNFASTCTITFTNVPCHGKRTVIAYANSRGSGVHRYPHSLTRTCAIRTHKR